MAVEEQLPVHPLAATFVAESAMRPLRPNKQPSVIRLCATFFPDPLLATILCYASGIKKMAKFHNIAIFT